jgi:hypothetical protein
VKAAGSGCPLLPRGAALARMNGVLFQGRKTALPFAKDSFREGLREARGCAKMGACENRRPWMCGSRPWAWKPWGRGNVRRGSASVVLRSCSGSSRAYPPGRGDWPSSGGWRSWADGQRGEGGSAYLSMCQKASTWPAHGPTPWPGWIANDSGCIANESDTAT